MTFEETVRSILDAERRTGSAHLHDHLTELAHWCTGMAAIAATAELRDNYYELRKLTEGWRDNSAEPADPEDSSVAEPKAMADDTGNAGSAKATKPPAGEQALADHPLPATTAKPAEPLATTEQTNVASLPQAVQLTGDGAKDEDASKPEPTAAGAPVVPQPQDPRQAVAEALAAYWHELKSDQDLTRYLGAFPDPGALADADQAAKLWERIHLVALRIPASRAVELRTRARQLAAEAAGTEAGEAMDTELAGTGQLVPELEIAGYPGAQLEPAPAADEQLRDLVFLARQVEWLATHDPAVKVGYRRINTSLRLRQFNDADLDIYRRLIKTNLEALGRVSDSQLQAVIDVDEGIRGVVPLPLPDESSWWSEQLQRSARMITGMFKGEIEMPPLQSDIKMVINNKLVDEKSNIGISAQEANTTRAGSVVWVLRAVRTGNKANPGRVIYVADSSP